MIMTTNPLVTFTYTLEELFTRFEQNINQQIAGVNEKIDKQSTEVKEQFAEVNQKLLKLEVGQAELSGEIKALDARLLGEIKAVDERLSGDIKTLDATVAGIGKRIDNAEFFDRGVAIAFIAAAST
jgi:hypothetical protein